MVKVDYSRSSVVYNACINNMIIPTVELYQYNYYSIDIDSSSKCITFGNN